MSAVNWVGSIKVLGTWIENQPSKTGKWKENIDCPPHKIASQIQYLISKSYIFQEIKREFCFLDDEKYYLVNILP